jgi:endonuclease/exonuclease/phosphatase family metal-dependent hydrolase
MRVCLASALAATVLLGFAPTVGATDRPVAGALLRLKAAAHDADRRSAAGRLADPAIAPPFPDLRSTGATLVINGGAARGQCYVSADLPAARWAPIGGDGARRGWRYRDPRGAVLGVRRVVLRPGAIVLAAKGRAWPCALSAAQRVPLSVVLRAGALRWCAGFGGTVAANARLRFRARKAVAPAACPGTDLTLADLNILHGLSCPAATNLCRFPDRVALFFDTVEAAGCPDAITLQEVRNPQVPILTSQLPAVCGGAYTPVYNPANQVDDAMVLSRVPAGRAETVPLFGGYRNVLHVRLDHPLGPLDVFTTHLGSGTGEGDQPCGASCPAACVAAGAATLLDCQAVQLAQLVEDRHDVPTPAVITGDFNAPPGSFAHAQLTDRGWLDVYAAAGGAECEPATGIGCTSGRVDDTLQDLESPAINESERIDFIFLVPAPGCRIERGRSDGTGPATALFADRPNPFAPVCGPAPAPVCWPSDHVGVQLALDCG